MTKRRADSLRYIMASVARLRLLKRIYSYSVLSDRTQFPKSVLCRYVKGTILPSEDTARRILATLEPLDNLRDLLKEKLKFTPEGIVETSMISFDPALLQRAALEIALSFSGVQFTKVITAATDGIPLATAAAIHFEIPLSVAKRTKDVAVKEFHEVSYTTASPVTVTSLFIPKGAIRKNDKVLIVDDVVRSGRTLQAMVHLVQKARAEVNGVFLLVAAGEEWKANVILPRGAKVVLGLSAKPEAAKSWSLQSTKT